MSTSKSPIQTAFPSMAVLLFAIILASLQINISLDMADEGFLWYGVWRTSLGETPILDFQSYDPGRYYWGAIWSHLLGDGIIATRISSTLFQCIGIGFGMAVIKRFNAPAWYQVLSGLLLVIWMFPVYRHFEPGIVMAGLFFAMFLLEHPSCGRHLAAGIYVGLAAWFGRNHGVYTAFAFLLLIHLAWLKGSQKDYLKHLGSWIIGIVIGYSPMLYLLLFVPGFYEQFFDSVLSIFRQKATNLPLPLPWPWTVISPWSADYSILGFTTYLKSFFSHMLGIFTSVHFIMGMFLVTWIVFIPASINCYYRSASSNRNAVSVILVSGVFSTPYLHYFLSRADIQHLSATIHPLLIGLLAIPYLFRPPWNNRIGLALIIVLLAITSLSAVKEHPVYRVLAYREDNYSPEKVGDDTLLVNSYTANNLSSLKKIKDMCSVTGDDLLVIPHWTTAYPLLKKKSPIREIYLLFAETPARQAEIIAELENNPVNCIVLGDIELDGKDSLRFRRTHPLVWRYLAENYKEVSSEGLPENFKLLRNERR